MRYHRIAIGLAVLGLAPGIHAASLDGLLDQLPAQNSEEARSINKGLLRLGNAGTAELCGRLVPTGSGDDTAVRFAINGLAKYVTRPDAEEERRAFALAICRALETSEDDEVKAFLLRQLQIAGGGYRSESG